MAKLELSIYQNLNRYEIDEVDGEMCMFDKSCSGSIILAFSEKVVEIGDVYLDGKHHTDWKFGGFHFDSRPMLYVYVRGYLCEYDTTAKIRVENFRTPDGRVMEPTEFTVTVSPRRDFYPECYREHDAVAFQAAAESMVLLKNEDVLPLKKTQKLNLFGEGVSKFRTFAIGAGRINPRGTRSVIQAVEETSEFGLNKELVEFYRVPNNHIPDAGVLERAIALNDTAIMVITRGTGENLDNCPIKGEYYLSDEEEDLLQVLTKTFKKTVVVLNVGYPIDVSFIDKYGVNAVLYTGLGGMYGADALISILDGRSNPCGRLPDTWAKDYYDIPAAHNFLNFQGGRTVLQTDEIYWSRICYEEGMYVGYRYFTSFDKPCAFPFGYGLSYTEFEQKMTSFSCEEDSIKVGICVKNTGEVAGKDVVQLYVSKPDGELEQAACELIDFAKTECLEPGSGEKLQFSIPKNRLASYSEEEAMWKLCQGRYVFWLGRNSNDLTQIGTFETEDVIVQKVRNRVCCPIEIEELSVKTEKTKVIGNQTFVSDEQLVQNKVYEGNGENKRQRSEKGRIMFAEVSSKPEFVSDFVNQMSDYELCRMQICWMISWNMNEKGVAGRTMAFDQYGLKEYVLTDGNNGLNMKKHNIGFPTSTMVAATFDKQLAYDVGRVIAEEARENDIDCILGPGMNLHRNPLNGRGAEYFSEDPLLAGVMAGYQNKGLQDQGVSGCLKHVVGNNCEAVRKRSDSIMTERTLRELYIRPFAYAMEVEPADTIMTGYNALNGCYCDEHVELLQGIFREELGFEGFFMSDWNSYESSDMKAMVNAGISLLTPGSYDDTRVTPLCEALEKGQITRKQLVKNVEHMVRVIVKRIRARENK